MSPTAEKVTGVSPHTHDAVVVGPTSVASQTNGSGSLRERKRIKRACDQCSISRTRCTGAHPCQHCIDYNRVCQYTRQPKRRGRIAKSLATPTSNAGQRTGNSCGDPISKELEEPDPFNDLITSSDVRDTPEFLRGIGPLESNLSSCAPESPFLQHWSSDLSASSASPPHSILGQQTNHSSRDTESSEPINSKSFKSNEMSLVGMFSVVSDANSINNAAEETSNIRNPSSPLITTSRARLLGYHDTHAEYRPGISNQPPAMSDMRADNTSSYKYPVLRCLVPYLQGIISLSTACNLLDLYFTVPSGSISHYASPFVLTSVFRKSSFLHKTSPRTTSPALLACILWVGAQTSNLKIFQSTVSRKNACDDLFKLCCRLLEEKGTESELLDKKKDLIYCDNNRVSEGSPDEVLTLALVSIVVSSGEPKRDCLKWWHRTIELAREQNLHKEVPAGLEDLDYDNVEDSITRSYRYVLKEETKEERRRVWWLLYAVDRHLSLSFNAPLNIQDSECSVFCPLDEQSWQEMDPELSALQYSRQYGPPLSITGCGFFEHFLPLMALLGDIIVTHHRQCHPRLRNIRDDAATENIEKLLRSAEDSLKQFAFSSYHTSYLPENKQVTIAYSTYILHVLYILLYGKWDPISMLDNEDNWIESGAFLKCMNHAVAAANSISDILKYDSEMRYMPYTFGIYLLHGSFMFILCADRQKYESEDIIGKACETVIRAYEVCVATLNTEYQV
ncbi:fungal-specific transcription factor domain-containing protein [Dipodascopsis uninucleata]